MEISEYSFALASFREALRIRRKALGSKHPLVIRLLNNIGCALFEMNDLVEANEAFGEALVVQRDLMKENSLGGRCSDGFSDDVSDDLALEDKNLEGDPKEAHNMLLSIALTLCNLGSIHLRWGKYDDSLVFYEDALLVSTTNLLSLCIVILAKVSLLSILFRSKSPSSAKTTRLF
jgi:tetratricopeptide (TPR) repeat protein